MRALRRPSPLTREPRSARALDGAPAGCCGSARAAKSSGFLGLATVLVLVAGIGCARTGQLTPPPAMSSTTDYQSLAQQHRELADRAGGLDRNNEQLHTMVAQLQQQVQLREEEADTLREQLKSTTAQLDRIKSEKTEVEQEMRTLTASMQRRVGATITANNSLRNSLPRINIEGAKVRADGDVVRIELPADKLFRQGSHELLPGAVSFIDRVGAEVKLAYPDNVIAVEGHTDNSPVSGSMFVHNHQLSVTRALAVFDVLTNSGRFPNRQLMLVGHGGNHPVVSNATPAGRNRNQRVELVVYPDKLPQQ